MTTKEFTDQLRLVADWTDAHDAGQHIASIAPRANEPPKVYLRNLRAMQALFHGQGADREKVYGSYIYTLAADGIVFVTSAPLLADPPAHEKISL